MALPAAYVINLDRSGDRLARFRARNRHLPEVSRFPGVDGGAVSRAELEAAGYVSGELDYGAGSLGCAVSHVKLWEMAAAEDRAITVFEDDAALAHQFERCADKVLSKLPADWDVVLWGNNFPPAFIWVDLGGSKTRIVPYGRASRTTPEEVEAFQQTATSEGAIRLLHAFGLCAYSISAAGAKKAVEHCRPLRRRSIEFPDAGVWVAEDNIDVALCGLYPSLKAFICLPPIAMTLHGIEPSVVDEVNAAP